jgi:uncharacterized membrane protein YebE (DUF533 family)
MNRMKIVVLTAVFVAGFATVAIAGTTAVDKRQANQRARIAQGVRSGELTRVETKRLVKGQVRIQKMERRAKSDGVVTARERVRLQKALNHESKAIAKKKHNKRSR